MPVAGPLQLAAPEALAQDGALVLRDGPLDLQQELIVRIIGDGVLQEDDLTSGAAELLQKQHLVGIFAGEAIGGQHGNCGDDPVAHGVAQRVEPGSVETAAAVSLVAEDVLIGEDMLTTSGPGAQGGKLAVDGCVALLALSGNAGIDGDVHGGLTSVWGVGIGNGGSERRRR